MNSVYNGCYRFVDTSFAVASATVSSATRFISSVAHAAIGASVDYAEWIACREKYNRRKSLMAFAKTVANEQVTRIAFPTKGIGPADVGDYIQRLKGTKVDSVFIPAHLIDAVGAQALENLKDTEVRTVRFCRYLGPVLARGFGKYLKNTQVTTVDLSNNSIDSPGARDFAKNLKDTKVTTVTLARNQICADGARELAEHLKNTQVTTVDLSLNSIGSAGARDFAKNLKGTRVTTVKLREAGIQDDGAKDFAAHLKDTQVTTVDLSYNSISSPGAREFVKNLKGTQVTTVFLEGNTISDDDLAKLISELAGTQVRELHVTVKSADDCYNRILSRIPLTNLIKIKVTICSRWPGMTCNSRLPEALTAACEENKRRLDRIDATRMYVESNLYKGESKAYNDDINSVNDVLCNLPKEICLIALNASMGIHDWR